MDRRQFLVSLLAATGPLALTQTAVAQRAASGGTPTTQYFALASKGGTFLEDSARLAYDKTSDRQVRRFARAEVLEQVRLAENLNANFDVATASAGSGPSGAGGALVGAGVGALVGGPVGAVVGAGVGAGSTALVGERAAPSMTTDAQKAATLTQLQAEPEGRTFDAMFVQAQIVGHQEALAIHGGYAQSGDDPKLRTIAANAVTLIQRHLAQLSVLERRLG
jgi:predicted outer membrane protein